MDRRVVRRAGCGGPLAITSVDVWRSLMAFREVRVVEVREVLRCWLAGDGLPRVAERAGVDRKTARRYVGRGVGSGAGPRRWRGSLHPVQVGASVGELVMRPVDLAPLVEQGDDLGHLVGCVTWSV
jgi:hypothetical protein